MQLKHSKARRAGVAGSLAAATCSLLCGAAAQPVVAEEQPRKWAFDTAIMHYGESDHVRDTSANASITRLFGGERSLNFKFTVDSLTGASASGAAPSTGAQTFTSPSGNSSYMTGAGQTPLDSTFLDTRFSLSADWVQPLGERMRVGGGVSFSTEYDYVHMGINGRLSRDFNQKNTSLNFGLSLASDQIDPVGGAPVALSSMLLPGDMSNKLSDDSKTVTDVLVGVTQVLGKRTIGQFNYSYSQASGYLTDPYKILSVVDPVTGDPIAGPGALNLIRYEGRPDSRAKQSLYGQVRHSFGRDIIDISYRYMTDDWGIDSHTVDLKYRLKFSKSYLQPHARFYTQGEADFYEAVLFDGDPLPKHASADYRLGELDAVTFGLKYGRPLGRDQEWSVRAEYYQQSGTSPPEAKVGSLSALDLDTELDSVILQLGYRF